ncbi:MAG: MOSC domain-containing protein [Tepidisphaeraceae bacterium]
MPARLVQLSVSPGGMPKLAVAAAMVSAEGVAGDWQRNRKYHGGPDRAVCVFSVELYDWLRERGIDLAPGSVGENFTTSGIDLPALSQGNRLRVGDCLIEITKIRVPCKNLDQWHPDLAKAMNEPGRSGWVARVLESAVVRPGDLIELLQM